MRICVVKATGRIIEMQERGTAETLLANAEAAGFAPDAVEVREVTAEEYAALIAEQDRDDIPVAELRRRAYQAETDGLFFKEQAGEVPAGTWATARAAIKAMYP